MGAKWGIRHCFIQNRLGSQQKRNHPIVKIPVPIWKSKKGLGEQKESGANYTLFGQGIGYQPHSLHCRSGGKLGDKRAEMAGAAFRNC